MVATGIQILHQQDFQAETEAEVAVGSGRIVRINIDGVCVLRIRMKERSRFVYHNDINEIEDYA